VQRVAKLSIPLNMNDQPIECLLFFQIALLTTKPRQATVTADGNLKCLTVNRRTFSRVMGPLQDILMRNIEEYNRTLASTLLC